MEKALENHVVLSTIFNYCNVEELRAVRRVSNRWLQESLPIWRKKSVIRIRSRHVGGELELTIIPRAGPRMKEEYYNHVEVEEREESGPSPWSALEVRINTTVTLDEFLDYVENSGRSGTGTAAAPFQNFQIEFPEEDSANWVETDASADVDILSPRFWQLCGPHMKHLEVNGYLQRHCGRLRELILGPTTTPRLETVVLQSNHVYRGEYQEAQQYSGGIPDDGFKPSYAPKPTVKSFKFVWDGCLQTGRSDVLHDDEGLREGDVDNSRTQLPFTWQELFTCFNNLEKLCISLYVDYMLPETVVAPLEALKQVKNLGGLGRLEHLSFRTRASAFQTDPDDDAVKQVLKILGETKIVLRSLTLASYPWGLRNDSVPELEFYHLLENQKEHLETLDIEDLTPPGQGIFPPGAIFPNLNTLVIDLKAFGGMELLQNNAPNLKAVRVLGDNRLAILLLGLKLNEKDFVCFDKLSDGDDDDGNETTGQKLPIIPIWENMKELVCHKVCTLKEILRMTKQMPNLEVLELPMENSALQLVCQKWTRLRRLTILEHPLGGVTDAGVVGCWDSPWPSTLPPASIKDLKDLSCLKCTPLGYEAYQNNFCLTFLSLSQGILELPRLRYLKINAQLSKTQKEELFRRVPSCILYSKKMSTGDWKIVTNIWRE